MKHVILFLIYLQQHQGKPTAKGYFYAKQFSKNSKQPRLSKDEVHSMSTNNSYTFLHNTKLCGLRNSNHNLHCRLQNQSSSLPQHCSIPNRTLITISSKSSKTHNNQQQVFFLGQDFPHNKLPLRNLKQIHFPYKINNTYISLN